MIDRNDAMPSYGTARDLWRLARRFHRLSPAHSPDRRRAREATARELRRLAEPRLKAEGLLMLPRIEQIARRFAA